MKKMTATLFLLLVPSVSFASSGFERVVNGQLGNGASISCNACHSGGTSTSTAILPMANTYRAARSAGDFTLISSSDSDGDGYINKHEVNLGSVDFNNSAVSPFTLATAANTDAQVKSLADNASVSAAFTDANGLAGAGKEILGGIKVTLNQADTLFFKAGGVDAADSVYVIDAAGAGTLLTNVDWTAQTDGGLVIKALPNGATSADYVVVRSVPVAGNAGVAANQGEASIYGCLSGSATMPLMLLMLLVGASVLRKRA